MTADQRTRVLELLKRHGWNATSFQVLEQGFRYWFSDDGEACVAYVDTGRAWVAAGAPVAAPERLADVADAFVAAGVAASRRVSFFATERRFVAGPHLTVMPIGEQPVWDPVDWPDDVRRSRTIREQLRRAAAKGVSVRLVSAHEIAIGPARLAIEGLIARWLASRPLAPMGFLVDVQPFSFADERRFFVAERAGVVVGFLAAVPVYTRGGWLLEDLLRDPAAPNGTSELLVDAAMRALADEGSRYVTLGLAPLAGPVSGTLGVIRDVGSSLYDFRGVYAFRAKLRPQRWDPIFLAYAHLGRPRVIAGTLAVLDALAAFARGRLAGFGVETLLRGPTLVVRGLAVLLVPWTIMLAFLGPKWFPSRAVHIGWVAFDVALATALFSLATRWRRHLAAVLVAAVSVDAALTCFQIATFNAQRARGVVEWLGLVVAALAPTLAAIILARASGLRRRGLPTLRPTLRHKPGNPSPTQASRRAPPQSEPTDDSSTAACGERVGDGHTTAPQSSAPRRPDETR